MKKKGILSLLIVSSVLISCGFRLIACADEAVPPEEVSVVLAEEVPVAVSPQPATDVASVQQAVDTAPALPVMEAAPAQTAMEAAPDQPVMETAPAQSTTAPASNPAPEPVANSAPVQSATTPASNPVPEAAADTPTSNSEPEPAVTPAADSSSEPVSAPVADSSSDHTTESTAESAETPAASASSESDTKPTNSLIEQTDIQATETIEPVTEAGLHAAESEMRAAEYNGESYTITLRNRVYGNIDTTSISLAAVFQLSIHKSYLPTGIDLDWFNSLFQKEGISFSDGSNFYTTEITLQNKETRSLQGIPSPCKVDVCVPYAVYEYNDRENKTQEFAESYIVGKEHTTDSSPTLNDSGNSTGDIEYTYLRFPKQDGKTLFIINDSDTNGTDPMELNLSVVVNGSYIFTYSDKSNRETRTISLTPDAQNIIPLMPGEYGFIIPDDHQSSTADLSKVKLIKTPTNVDVTKGVSSIGNYDETNHEMTISIDKLDDLGVNPAIYSLFRAEEPKTDLGTPKTDDGNPGTDPGSDPGSPDPENNPGNPNPDPTPGNDPGNPDPGNNTEIYTPVINHTTSSPIKNKKSPDTDQPSAGTSVSQKSPSVGTSSPQTEAVDTADRTPISMYVLLMLAALVVTAAAIMISAVRSRRQFRR